MSSNEISILLDQTRHFDNGDPIITISTEQSYEIILISNNICLEAIGSYTDIISKEGKNFLSSNILKDFEV